MSDTSYQYESIECNSAYVFTRKQIYDGMHRLDDLGIVQKYKCDINSTAEIIKELDPKVFVFKEKSKLDMGDKLKCEGLYFFVKSNKHVKFNIVNKTSRHKGSDVTTNKFTFAEVTKPFQDVINALEKK